MRTDMLPNVPDYVFLWAIVAVFFTAIYLRAVLMLERIERRNFWDFCAYAYIHVAVLFPLWIPMFLPLVWWKLPVFAICVWVGVLAFRKLKDTKLENNHADSRTVDVQKRG